MATDDKAADDRDPAAMADRGTMPAESDPDVAPDPAELARELKAAKDHIKRLNGESTARRQRIEELEDEDRKRAEAKLTDDERVKRQLSEATTRVGGLERENGEMRRRLVSLRLDHAIEREAASLFEYPEDVPKLIDRDRIEHDEATDKFVGVKEAVKKLADQRPGLLRQRGGGGTPPPAGQRRSAGGVPATSIEERTRLEQLASGRYGGF